MEKSLVQLFNPEGRLKVEEDDYLERPDISEKAVYILGNYDGSINLCHIILYLSNEAETIIDIAKLPFIQNTMNKPVLFRSTFSEDDVWGENGFVENDSNNVTWTFGETTASQIASYVHGLGYSWNHLHFDAKDASHYSLFMAIE